MEKLLKSVPQTAGVDISKGHLDICLHRHGGTRRFANDAKGFAALVAWLAPHAFTRAVFAATGAYHRGFERAPGDRGLPMVKVNPRQARVHAEAIGRRAKTDRVDAAMVARLGALRNLPATPFEPRYKYATKVSLMALVRYRMNDYSVRAAYPFATRW